MARAFLLLVGLAAAGLAVQGAEPPAAGTGPAAGRQARPKGPEAPQARAARPLALRCGRVLPVEGDPLRDAVILVREGRIAALGRGLAIPEGAEVIEAADAVAVPGFVAPVARIGLPARSPRTGADRKAAEEIDPFAYDWSRLARHGFTTVNLVPDGEGILGRGTAIHTKPVSTRGFEARRKAMLRREATALRIVFRASTSAKQALRKAYEEARKGIEEEKAKAKGAAKKAAGPKKEEPRKEAGGKKDAGKKKEAGKKPAEEAKPKPPSPAQKVLRDAVRGRIPTMIRLPRAADVAHFAVAIRGLEVPGWLDIDGSALPALDRIRALKRPIIAPPAIPYMPGTRIPDPFIRRLAWEGTAIAFRPMGWREEDFAEFSAHVSRFVRAGLARSRALRAATLEPARAIGLDAEIGSLKPGKAADIVLLSGDPFEPATRVLRVFIAGETAFRIEDVIPPPPEGAGREASPPAGRGGGR